jgi:tetratricopeptide (TPR) repeat protein
MLVQKEYAEAHTELSRAATLAEDIGRVRLQMDVQLALARLHAAQGQRELAQRHRARAREIAEAIEESLESSGLEARLRMD